MPSPGLDHKICKPSNLLATKQIYLGSMTLLFYIAHLSSLLAAIMGKLLFECHGVQYNVLDRIQEK